MTPGGAIDVLVVELDGTDDDVVVDDGRVVVVVEDDVGAEGIDGGTVDCGGAWGAATSTETVEEPWTSRPPRP